MSEEHPYRPRAHGPLKEVYRDAVQPQREVECGECKRTLNEKRALTIIRYPDPQGYEHIHGYVI